MVLGLLGLFSESARHSKTAKTTKTISITESRATKPYIILFVIGSCPFGWFYAHTLNILSIELLLALNFCYNLIIPFHTSF